VTPLGVIAIPLGSLTEEIVVETVLLEVLMTLTLLDP
jgi:hypothetical protein